MTMQHSQNLVIGSGVARLDPGASGRSGRTSHKCVGFTRLFVEACYVLVH
jgi:hypothetical protein